MAEKIQTLAARFWREAPRDLPIFILPHYNADGDALASSLALAAGLKQLGFSAEILLDENVAERYSFLPGQETCQQYSAQTQLPASYQVFLLDCHEASRLGRRAPLFAGATQLFIMDHHEYQIALQPWMVIEPERSSTAEMLFVFLQALGRLASQDLLNQDCASLLAAGIYSDTGGLRFSNTNQDTYEVMAALMPYQPPIHRIAEQLFTQVPLEEARARGLALLKARTECDGKLIWCYFRERELLACNIDKSQTSVISSLLKQVAGTDLAIFMREDPLSESRAELSLSIRSSDNFDAAHFAQSLGGGGHQRAAGATLAIEEDIYDTVEYVLTQARAALGFAQFNNPHKLSVRP